MHLEISVNALAKSLQVSPNRINQIVREERGVTPDTALRLARYFGGDAQSWLNMQQTFDLKVARNKVGAKIDREIMPRKEKND